MSTLAVSVPWILKATAWGLKFAPEAVEAAQSIAAAAESGVALIELVKEARGAFGGRPKQSLLLRRCVLITGLAVRAAKEVAPPAGDAESFEDEVKLAWNVCAEKVPDPEDEAALGNALNDWLAPPLSTPWGRALWDVLARRQTVEDAPVLASALERRAFERRFMAAWSLNTSTGDGQELERAVLGLREVDAQQLREQLVAELATWGGRHVFGNQRAGAELQGMPWMSLEAIYVEPEVDWGQGESRQRGPALRTLWQSVQAHPLVLVTADMGLGKTLTARTFMTERALDWMEAKDAPGDRWLPIYVRCADHMQEGRTDLEDLVADSWASQWKELSGERLRPKDPRFGLPRDKFRLVIVLDGLDEVNLSHTVVERFLRQILVDECCKTLRVVVFSRPGAVPEVSALPDGILTLKVRPWDEQRVNDWLGRWAALGQSGPAAMAEVREDSIRTLLQTPVLLFMMAWTWHTHGGRLPGKAALYERFLRKVARGKAVHDQDKHPVIAKASNDALHRLITLQHLAQGATPDDAMLWLLGRVALEVHRREQRPGAGVFRRRDVENLLNNALELEGDSAALGLISLACVLAMQADLRGDQPVLLFGHRSFQEFLVAWACRAQLRRIVAPQGDHAREEEEELLEGLLIQGPEDRTIDFLLELVKSEDSSQQALLKDWAKRMAADPRVGPLTSKGAERRAAHSDTRAPLALMAFGIGGALAGEEGFVIQGPLPLRRVLAWAWLTQREVRVIAPRLRHGEGEEWCLSRANLNFADLSYADLSYADLSGAILYRVNLSGTNLRGADLSFADLSLADLSHADLSEVDMSEANLPDANLSFANLAGVDLSFLNLTSVNLTSANLSCSKLYRANLPGANLFDANLSYADFSHSRLGATNLSNAQYLPTANLLNARFTLNHPYYRDTLWPSDFDPIAAGARPNLPGEDAWPAPHPDPDEQEPPPPTSAEDGDAT